MIFEIYDYLNDTNIIGVMAVIFYIAGFISTEMACIRIAKNEDIVYFEDHYDISYYSYKFLVSSGLLKNMHLYEKPNPQIPNNDTNIGSIADRMIGEDECKVGIALKTVAVIVYFISKLVLAWLNTHTML